MWGNYLQEFKEDICFAWLENKIPQTPYSPKNTWLTGLTFLIYTVSQHEQGRHRGGTWALKWPSVVIGFSFGNKLLRKQVAQSTICPCNVLLFTDHLHHSCEHLARSTLKYRNGHYLCNKVWGLIASFTHEESQALLIGIY